ncbi:MULTISPECIES: cation-transporting P-type ATPase [unclassified Nocardioides]|uniref:cation-transporting P-type ATPase n=1 Tax=unclassified Nocardioides TaxID=2615069 RepID=UPI0013FD9431|nr:MULTISPECIES: cation-transporting P-type ATPase [unclassified Nocardioides]
MSVDTSGHSGPGASGHLMLDPIQAVLVAVGSDTDGLSSAEAARRLAETGPNTLSAPPRASFLAALGRQLAHPLALLLWVAAGLALAVVPAAFAYRLPAGPPAADLAPLLCGGIIGYRALLRAQVPPAGTLVPVALEALGHGGALALAGIHMSDVPPLDYQRHLFLERDLRTVTSNTRRDGEELLALAERLGVRTHVTTYGFDQVDLALRDLAAGRLSGSAVVATG